MITPEKTPNRTLKTARPGKLITEIHARRMIPQADVAAKSMLAAPIFSTMSEELMRPRAEPALSPARRYIPVSRDRLSCWVA